MPICDELELCDILIFIFLIYFYCCHRHTVLNRTLMDRVTEAIVFLIQWSLCKQYTHPAEAIFIHCVLLLLINTSYSLVLTVYTEVGWLVIFVLLHQYELARMPSRCGIANSSHKMMKTLYEREKSNTMSCNNYKQVRGECLVIT